MVTNTDLTKCIKILNFLQSHSPNIISRRELSEEFNIPLRSISRYANKLKPLGVESVRGKNGGFYYNGKSILPMAFQTIDDLFALNLSLNNDSVIDKINILNKNGIKLSKNLIFTNNKVNDEDMEKMVKICDAIYKKNNIVINYTKGDNNYNCYVSPICFKNYDGLIYLYAYYRNEVHSYALSKLKFIEYTDKKFEINKMDLVRIKNIADHEIGSFDKPITFRIKANKLIYNRLKKVYKDTVNIDYEAPVSTLSITTSSYKEEVSLLLSLGSNFEFIDKDNEVYALYVEEINKINKLI